MNIKSGLTFGRGLRTILRADPDVLLVGEIRDEETARIAVQAALTGHLVLSTLHAHNAASSIARLKDMGVEPNLLATSINASSRSGSRGGSASTAASRTTRRRRSAQELEAIGRGPALQGGRLRPLRGHGLPRPGRALRGHAVAGQAAQPRRGLDRPDLRRRRGAGHDARCARTACASALAGVTSFEEVRRVTGDRLRRSFSPITRSS